MSRWDNLKKQATEAAESDFLWYLGYLAPSRHRASDVCSEWGLDNKDQKRVTAVTALRDQAPEILAEIRDDAAENEEDEIMAEVVLGEKHYEKIAEKKDRELWEGIMRSLGVPSERDLPEWVREKYPVPKSLNYPEAGVEEEVNRKSSRRSWTIYCPYDLPNRVLVDLSGFVFHRDGYCNIVSQRQLIHIRPSSMVDGNVEVRKDWIRESSFYEPRHVRAYRWNPAVIFVEDKSALALAKKIANAYEAAMRRRRQRAKAVVVKNC